MSRAKVVPSYLSDREVNCVFSRDRVRYFSLSIPLQTPTTQAPRNEAIRSLYQNHQFLEIKYTGSERAWILVDHLPGHVTGSLAWQFLRREKNSVLCRFSEKNIRKISVIFTAKNFPVLYILGCLITQQTSVKTERTVENIFFYVRLMTREIYIDAVK